MINIISLINLHQEYYYYYYNRVHDYVILLKLTLLRKNHTFWHVSQISFMSNLKMNQLIVLYSDQVTNHFADRRLIYLNLSLCFSLIKYNKLGFRDGQKSPNL